MKDDELNKFASQFINLWQENFSKAIGDQKIIDHMMQATSNMQQFYDNFAYTEKSSAATAASSHEFGAAELHRGELLRRIDELEQRVTTLEKRPRKVKPKNK